MTTKYKDIEFIAQNFNRETDPPTLFYYCANNYGETIGMTKWDKKFERYCYFDICFGIYTSGCLQDISNFLDQLNKTKTKPESNKGE